MPSPSLLDTFRALVSLEPRRQSLAGAPWEAFVDWAIAQGLAPLVAYNLEYRLTGGGAPEWARDRLLSVYQGSVNDNVMKLVLLKRALGELEGRKLVVTGAASFAEALYPHIAFRPVPEIELHLREADLEGLTGFLKGHHLKPIPIEDSPDATRVLSDGHSALVLTAHAPGAAWEAALERALPMRVYGPSVYRLDLEDAVLWACLDQARRGYEVPAITWVDLRELITGAPSMGGPYSRPCDPERVKARAREWRIERALYASASVVGRLFPEARGAVEQILPPLRPATRALLDRWVVDPVSELGKRRVLRGIGRLRRLLAAGTPR